jgi:predicted amidophosphoribosyltransferase
MGLLLGLFIAFCVALWTYKDAKRRGMQGAGGWAAGVFLLLIVFLPLYLAQRKPLAGGPIYICAGCRNTVPPGAQFCSACGMRMATSPYSIGNQSMSLAAPPFACPHCKGTYAGYARFCPLCGGAQVMGESAAKPT